MSGGFTVSPVVTTDDAGNEQLADFEISGQNGFDSNNERFGGTESDYVLDEHGNAHHVMQDVEIDDGEIEVDGNLAFAQAIFQAYPEFESAQKWAAQALSETDIDNFDQLMDSDNPQEIYRAVETLIMAYRQSGSRGNPPQTPPQPQQQPLPPRTLQDTANQAFGPEDEAEAEANFGAQVMETVGGRDNYRTLITWASEHMSDSFIDNFDAIIDQGDPHKIVQAVDILKEAFIEGNRQ